MRAAMTRNESRKVREIELKAELLVDDGLAGQYQAVFKGFASERAHVPARSLDRGLGTLVPGSGLREGRRLLEEHGASDSPALVFMIDLCASFDLGPIDRRKREWMAELAGVLAFSALRNDDRVGLMLFTDDVELYVPPRRGRSHAMRVLREIMFFAPRGRSSDVARAIDFAKRTLDRRAITFLLSDFTMMEEFDAQMEQLRPKLAELNVRHDVVALSVNDPCEFLLPEICFWGQPECGPRPGIEVDTSNARIRRSYSAEIERRQLQLGLVARSAGVDVLDLISDEPYLPVLTTFFSRRERRNSA
jgi:uncharacterized protein (DUF58 family)